MGFFSKRKAVNQETNKYMNEGKGNCNRSDNYRERALQDEVSNYGWYTCPQCGGKFRKSDMEADHIVPHSKGGDNSRGNLQLICRHCNRSKGASTSETRKDLARKRSQLHESKKAMREALSDAYDIYDELSKKK